MSQVNDNTGSGMMTAIVSFFKSKQFLTFIASLAVMAAISFAYFYPDAAEGNVLRQGDMMQGKAIGQETAAYAEATGIKSWWTGSLFSGMPTFQISPSYSSNSLFDWITTVYGLGLPSPANLLFMMMAGMFILLVAMRLRWYNALVGALAWGFSTYFIIIIGAGHIWKFVTLAYVPPTIAGIVLAYRGRYIAGGALTAFFGMMQIASNHVQMTYYFLFVVLGFIIVYLIEAIKEGQLKRFGIATAAMVVAGGLAVTANLPSLYNTYEYSKETMRGGHSELTSGESADASQVTGGLNRDYITQYSYGRGESMSLLIPNIKGGASAKPKKGEMTMLSLADLDDAKQLKGDPIASQYIANISQYFGEPEGTNGPVYVGALICALFLLGCFVVKGPMKWMLLVLTIFSLLLALGRNAQFFTDLMIDYMPMYSKFRTVESILVIAEFTMPVMAALTLQAIFTRKDFMEKHSKVLYATFGVVLAYCLLVMLFPSLSGNAVTDTDYQRDAMMQQMLSQQGVTGAQAQAFSLNNPTVYAAVESLRYSMVQSDALRSFLIVALGFVFIFLYFRQKLSATISIAALGVVVLVDLFAVNKRYIDHDAFVPKRLNTGAPIPMTAADRKILQDTTMNYRVFDMPQFYGPNPSYYHKSIGGYHAAKLTRYQDIIDRHLSKFMSNEMGDADWNVLNMLNAKYVVDGHGEVLPNPEAMGNAWWVDTITYVKGADAEMEALGRINPKTTAVADEQFKALLGQAQPKAPGDTIYETYYAPDKVSYHTRSSRGGIAVFSEVYFPWGWHVAIDGKEVEGPGRVNYILRALQVPAGEHTVEMTFNPESVNSTVSAATVAVIIIYVSAIAAVVLYFVRRRKSEETQE